MNPDKVFEEAQYTGKSYLDDYDQFIKNLESQGGNMAPGEVGEMTVRMTQYYNRYNLQQSRANKIYYAKAQEIYSSVDNGKPISAAKAEIIAAATPEYAAYNEAKTHVQNIEQCINALKALQRGITNEHSYSGAQ